MLENKLGITDKAALNDAEEKICKRRAKELFDSGALEKTDIGTFKGLADIHEYLFGDIYDFAGKVRTVDIAKGNTRFSPVNILSTSLGFVDIMPQESFDDVVDKYIEMNVAHPFRSGNGRALRIWLNVMMKSAIGEVVDYSAIAKDEFNTAMERCAVDDEMLYKLFKKALTKDVGRDAYLRSMDASFAFEDYNKYSITRL